MYNMEGGDKLRHWFSQPVPFHFSAFVLISIVFFSSHTCVGYLFFPSKMLLSACAVHTSERVDRTFRWRNDSRVAVRLRLDRACYAHINSNENQTRTTLFF